MKRTDTNFRRPALPCLRPRAGRAARGLLLLAIIGLLTGCTQFDLRRRIPWGAGIDGELEPPMRMAAVWGDYVLHTQGRTPVRGFGGRIMFYGKDPNKPVKVAGTLVVYAFDETQRDPTNIVPDRKYVFLPDQLSDHYSKNELGHSYSFWLPWDEVGGLQKEISLIARFTPERGPVVVSEQSKHILSGRLPPAVPPVNPPDGTWQGAVPAWPAPAAWSPPASFSPPHGAMPMPGSPGETPYAVQQAAWHTPAPMLAGQQSIAPTGYAAPVPSASGDAASPERRMQVTTIPIQSRYAAQRRRALSPVGASAMMPPPAAENANHLQPPHAWGAYPQPAQPHHGSTSQPQLAAEPGLLPPNAAAVPIHAADASSAQQPAPAAGQPSARFGPQRHRPLGAPIERLDRGRDPWPPRPAG